jgi:hypothetical protein
LRSSASRRDQSLRMSISARWRGRTRTSNPLIQSRQMTRSSCCILYVQRRCAGTLHHRLGNVATRPTGWKQSELTHLGYRPARSDGSHHLGQAPPTSTSSCTTSTAPSAVSCLMTAKPATSVPAPMRMRVGRDRLGEVEEPGSEPLDDAQQLERLEVVRRASPFGPRSAGSCRSRSRTQIGGCADDEPSTRRAVTRCRARPTCPSTCH